jgi:adenylate kinase
MGPPGSGKGSLSEMCVDRLGWLHLSTGDLCRQHIAESSDFGKQIQQIIASGGLVPEAIISDMVQQWIIGQKTISKDLVFDGYPRTKGQAEALYNFVKNKLPDVELVLVKLNIDQDTLVDRIIHRVTCSNKNCGRVYSISPASEMQPKKDMICDVCGSALIRRSDDTQASLKHRLNIYFQHEQEIINFFVDKGFAVVMLQACQTMQNLFQDFKKIALCDYVY